MVSLGAAAALVASGMANARRLERQKAASKQKWKDRKKELKEKYKKKYSNETEQIMDRLLQNMSVGSLPEARISCPECHRPFSIIEMDDLELDLCQPCQSFWFDRGELKEFSGLDSDVPGNRLTSRKSKYGCPICSKPMKEHVFMAPHNILVDVCEEHGVYLEDNEINRVVEIS